MMRRVAARLTFRCEVGFPTHRGGERGSKNMRGHGSMVMAGLVALLACGLIAAGCGDDDSTNGTSGTSAESSTSTDGGGSESIDAAVASCNEKAKDLQPAGRRLRARRRMHDRGRQRQAGAEPGQRSGRRGPRSDRDRVQGRRFGPAAAASPVGSHRPLRRDQSRRVAPSRSPQRKEPRCPIDPCSSTQRSTTTSTLRTTTTTRSSSSTTWARSAHSTRPSSPRTARARSA